MYPIRLIAHLQPIGFEADGGALARQLSRWASDVLVVAEGQCLVRSAVVLTVVDTVAHLSLLDAPKVVAGEFALGTLGVVTPLLVGPVSTIILVVALPRVEDAAAIAAAEFCRLAGVD